MSDTPTPAAEQPTAETEQPTQEAPAQETDWKAEARKWEARAKQNAEAAKRLAEIEEASKTEAQKQAERLAELEAKVAEYEQREQIAAWKAQVSEETGVPAEALRGSSLEEIQEHAQTLKSLIPAEEPKKGAVAPYVPAEGATPRGELGGSAAAFAAAIEPILT